MVYHRQKAFRPRIATGLAALVGLVVPGSAEAHVKWFCAFDVAGQPRGLENVLCPDFEQLLGLTIVALLLGALLEGSRFGTALLRATGRVLAPVATHSDQLIRTVAAFFFVALWTQGGIILTPELTTTSPFIPWLQLLIAFAMGWRCSLPFAALGIFVLFGIALHDFGLFHLLDYPIFLGLAIYLGLQGLWSTDLLAAGLPAAGGPVAASLSDRLGRLRRAISAKAPRPLDVLRWSAAITLMWASIEKWAYPEWTFPLFAQHPDVALGFDRDFFMRAAGMVEFALSFALIATPLCRRFAAIILAGMFVSAVAEFGKIDAIGHAPIIVVMLALAAEDVVETKPGRAIVWLPIGFVGTLGAVLAVYYGLHSLMFGTTLI